MDNIMLSVICTTYGHEKYLRQALDSILMQKVSFPIEVLIGEDCSPDNSRSILKEYERKYPGFFTMIYRDENFGAGKNFFDLGKRTKGKYIAFLELDDYWIDCYKLQKQVDILENDKSIVAVAARTLIVDKNGNPKNEKYPECTDEYYRWKHYLNWLLPGQTASIVCKNLFLNWSGINAALLSDVLLFPGDRKLALLFLDSGKVYCMSEIMSAYRHVQNEGFSYSARKRDYSNYAFYREYTDFYHSLLQYAYQFSKKICIINSEKIYVLFNVHLKREQKEKVLRYLLFDLDVRYKKRVLMFLAKKAMYRFLATRMRLRFR